MKKFLFSLLISIGNIGILSAQVEVLQDNSLEASGASNNGIWTSTSTNFGTTYCSVINCGNGTGPMVPHSGTYYSWFGGIDDAETGTIKQTFNVATAGDGQLKFFWKMPLRDATDIFRVELDGTPVYTLPSGTSTFTDYEEKIINLGNISAGSHSVTFYTDKTSGHSFNLGVDDVSLIITNNLGVQDINLSSGISIYNNYQERSIYITNKTREKIFSIEVYNASGQLYSQSKVDLTNSGKISTLGWSTGVYLLKIKTEKGEFISKKVIVK